MIKTRILMICLLTSLSGCFYTKIPELPKLEPRVCPSVTVPSPTPKDMRLIIANGKIVEADPAAEAWLREVIALRKTIKQQWPGS